MAWKRGLLFSTAAEMTTLQGIGNPFYDYYE